jgi:hypothetical protein
LGIKVNAEWVENRPEFPEDVRIRFDLLLTAMNDMIDLRQYIRDEQDASVKIVMSEELIIGTDGKQMWATGAWSAIIKATTGDPHKSKILVSHSRGTRLEYPNVDLERYPYSSEVECRINQTTDYPATVPGPSLPRRHAAEL